MGHGRPGRDALPIPIPEGQRDDTSVRHMPEPVRAPRGREFAGGGVGDPVELERSARHRGR